VWSSFPKTVWIFVLCPGANTWRFKNIKLTDSFWKVFRFMSWRCRNSITGIGFLSVGFPSKKCSEQANTCLWRDFLFKVFAHCNRIDSLEGIACSLYGIIQEQSSCFCWCNSQKVCFHSFNLRRLFEQPLTAHELPPPFFIYFTSHINTRNNTKKSMWK
jgi:hypothetical protein